jgi:hypothetical protein
MNVRAVVCLKSGTRGGMNKLREGPLARPKGAWTTRKGGIQEKDKITAATGYASKREQEQRNNATRKVPLVMYGIQVMRRSAAIPGLATAKRVFLPAASVVGGIEKSLDPLTRTIQFAALPVALCHLGVLPMTPLSHRKIQCFCCVLIHAIEDHLILLLYPC